MLLDIEAAQTPEEWVGRACGPALDRRSFLPYVHVLDGVAYATDAIRLHYAKTAFPDGVYDPVSFMLVDWEKAVEPADVFDPTFVGAWTRLCPSWDRLTQAQISEIEESGVGPLGEDALRVCYFGTYVRVCRSHMAEAHNGSAATEVFFREDGPGFVAGVSNFGHYKIALYRDQK